MSKKNLFGIFAFLCIILSACSSSDDDNAVVSLSGNSFQLPANGSVIVKLNVKNYSGGDVQIPITFSGTAIKGTDYTVSSETFDIKGGSKSAEITFIAKYNYGDDKTINISLGNIPGGIGTEGNTSAVISILSKDNIYYTFDKGSYLMTQTATPTIMLKSGALNYKAEEDIIIPIEIDADGTTAVEGTHFQFIGNKEAVIEKGKSSATVNLNWLKNEAGKDVVKLKIGTITHPGLYAGLNNKATVKLFGPIAGQIKGTWVGVSFANYEWLNENCGWLDPAELYPTISANDKLIIGDEGLTTDLAGPLKNYFRNGAIEFLKEESFYYDEDGFGAKKKTVQTIKLSNVNVNFSATKTDIRDAIVSLRVVQSTDGKILEVTIADYEPTDFLIKTFTEIKPLGETPIMSIYPLRFTFKEVKE